MTAPIASPNRRESHLAHLPTPALLNRSVSSKSSLGGDDARMAALCSATNLPLPFPRQTSAEFFRSGSTPSPSTGPSTPFDMSSSTPTWPNPASYSFSHSPSQTSACSTPRPHANKASSMQLVCFELALSDRLAAKLDGDRTLASIQEASGVVSTELSEVAPGPKKLVSTGSASAVQKARQLLDVKLSQTPIRTLVGLKLPADTGSLTAIPATGPHISRLQPLAMSTYRLAASPLPPTSESAERLRDEASSVGSRRSLCPSRAESLDSTTSSVVERVSMDGLRSSATSPGSPVYDHTTSTTVLPAAESQTEASERLPQIGDFGHRRELYIDAMLAELEFAVKKRRSLARVKLDLGSQEWRRDGHLIADELEESSQTTRWSLDQVERWRTDSSASAEELGRSESCPISPVFSPSLSSTVAQNYLSRLMTFTDDTFERKGETSQVRILHLDKARASFGCAIAECRGQELRNLPRGSTASGTLMLKKCSTLPAKPFALSVVSPPPVSAARSCHGQDLRVSILTDKAATSPSLDLSAAMQSATWEVGDRDGSFRVKVNLKEERFGKGETQINWNSRERWQNQDNSLRFTFTENRYSESSRHDYSIQLSSPALNQALASYALDQAQGKKVKWDRAQVKTLVEQLVRFAEKLVDRDDSG